MKIWNLSLSSNWLADLNLTGGLVGILLSQNSAVDETSGAFPNLLLILAIVLGILLAGCAIAFWRLAVRDQGQSNLSDQYDSVRPETAIDGEGDATIPKPQAAPEPAVSSVDASNAETLPATLTSETDEASHRKTESGGTVRSADTLENTGTWAEDDESYLDTDESLDDLAQRMNEPSGLAKEKTEKTSSKSPTEFEVEFSSRQTVDSMGDQSVYIEDSEEDLED